MLRAKIKCKKRHTGRWSVSERKKNCAKEKSVFIRQCDVVRDRCRVFVIEI